MSQYDGYAPQGITGGGVASLTPWTEPIDGGGFTLSDAVLASDVNADAIANLVRTDKANTFGAFLNTFAGSSLRIPFSATPTIAVDGDIGIDSTITDFSTPLIRYFGTESMVLIGVPSAEIDTAPADGDVLAYNATTDEFEFVPASAGGEVFTWSADHDADGNSLLKAQTVEINNPAGTFQFIIKGTAIGQDRDVTIPLVAQNDVFLMLSLEQNLVNKTLVGGVTANQFQDNGLVIQNPADTFNYTIQSAAIVADRILNLPLLTETSTIFVTPVSATLDMNSNNLDNFLALISDNASPASAGEIRLGNTESIQWRNGSDNGNSILTSNSSNEMVMTGTFVGFNMSNKSIRESAGIFAAGNEATDGFIRMINSAGDANSILWRNAGNSANFGITANASDQVVIQDADLLMSSQDLITDTTDGTEIATAVGQKLGFWGSTPLVQQSVGADTLANLYTLLRAIGIVA